MLKNMNTKNENGSLIYSIKLMNGKVINNTQRKSTDLCPICKNGLGCENSFAHGRLWI